MTPPEHRRVLMHVCTHVACDAVEVDGSCNHSQYMCYRLDVHVLPQPMRPLFFVADVVQPDAAAARAIREQASGGAWRRPSEHFENNYLTAAAPGEDWVGWPDATVPTAGQPTWIDDVPPDRTERTRGD